VVLEREPGAPDQLLVVLDANELAKRSGYTPARRLQHQARYGDAPNLNARIARREAE
jgi:hypothetical protein